MGFAGTDNKTAVPLTKLEEWQKAGAILYVPAEVDVRPQMALADCVVLPSYREGTPRSLLEAASMAKPIITTDVPGCRQVVEHDVTGFLVRVRDAGDLVEKMERMMRLPEQERIAMGMRGREKMMREFDERIVIEEYLQAIREFAPIRAAPVIG
jgi:glycosyltransferase involved in cell wall biosynthesis